MATRTPLKAIRAKCMDCTCGQFTEIKECPITDCPLYEYRTGHRPTTVLKRLERKSKEIIEEKV